MNHYANILKFLQNFYHYRGDNWVSNHATYLSIQITVKSIKIESRKFERKYDKNKNDKSESLMHKWDSVKNMSRMTIEDYSSLLLIYSESFVVKRIMLINSHSMLQAIKQFEL